MGKEKQMRGIVTAYYNRDMGAKQFAARASTRDNGIRLRRGRGNILKVYEL
jgi:hypothetical protein